MQCNFCAVLMAFWLVIAAQKLQKSQEQQSYLYIIKFLAPVQNLKLIQYISM